MDPEEYSRQAFAVLDEMTTPYAVRIVTEECGQQIVVPGMLLDISKTADPGGPQDVRFAPIFREIYTIGDHTLVHDREAAPWDDDD